MHPYRKRDKQPFNRSNTPELHELFHVKYLPLKSFLYTHPQLPSLYKNERFVHPRQDSQSLRKTSLARRIIVAEARYSDCNEQDVG